MVIVVPSGCFTCIFVGLAGTAETEAAIISAAAIVNNLFFILLCYLATKVDKNSFTHKFYLQTHSFNTPIHHPTFSGQHFNAAIIILALAVDK